MEVTFNTGLEDISKHISENKEKKSETVWEAYLRKRKEKKKARKTNAKSSDDESDYDQEAAEQPDDFFIEEPSTKGKGASKRNGVVTQKISLVINKLKFQVRLRFLENQQNNIAPKKRKKTKK
ncbi:hypothetical protein LIER_16777 [Lithospermum erythrorhizon]|uniref:Uncharacterized protein n=1 Tax=Lithospermum erythrorhizon TaxID=34254 RepID=A0AAV3QCC6_LITER